MEHKPETATEALAELAAKSAEQTELNYQIIIDLAQRALISKRLTDADRKAVEIDLASFKMALKLRRSRDTSNHGPAADVIATSVFGLGARVRVSESVLKYARFARSSKGGKTEKERRRLKRLAKEVWQNYMYDCISRYPETSNVTLAESMQADKAAPKSLPLSLDYLTRKIGKARRHLARNKRHPRLVHSA